MENNNSNSGKITKADWVTFVGYSLFAALSAVGLSFSMSWPFAIVVTMLLILLTILIQWLLIRLKKVEGHFVAFRIVEYFVLVFYLFAMLVIIDIPMARSLSVIIIDKDRYKEYALQDLAEVSQCLKDYENQEQEAITQCRNSLTRFAYMPASDFSIKAAEYANFYLGHCYYSTSDVTDFYRNILNRKFFGSFNDYSSEINSRVDELRSSIENNWEFNSSSLSSAVGRKSIQTLRAEVSSYLTGLSQSVHTDDDGNEHAYKFEFFRGSDNKIAIKGISEMKYDYSLSSGRLASEVEDVFPLGLGMFGTCISIIINLLMIFTYVMAFRSTKVAIRKHYRRNKMNIGGIEL